MVPHAGRRHQQDLPRGPPDLRRQVGIAAELPVTLVDLADRLDEIHAHHERRAGIPPPSERRAPPAAKRQWAADCPIAGWVLPDRPPAAGRPPPPRRVYPAHRPEWRWWRAALRCRRGGRKRTLHRPRASPDSRLWSGRNSSAGGWNGRSGKKP